MDRATAKRDREFQAGMYEAYLANKAEAERRELQSRDSLDNNTLRR